MEASAWSLQDDAHKPGRLWTGKTFWMNPVFEVDYIDRMFAKCHEDFVKDPINTSYLIVVPELRDAPWYKRWVKYYDIVDKHPRGSKLFTTKAAHTYNTSKLEPARDAGNAGR
eukprot:3294380-Pyramimonas_sp.AAC.1